MKVRIIKVPNKVDSYQNARKWKHANGGDLLDRLKSNIQNLNRDTAQQRIADNLSSIQGNESSVFGGGEFSGAGASSRFAYDPDNIMSQWIRNTPIPVEVSFSDAYTQARQNGQKTFIFNGKEYNTDYDPNAKLGKREYESTLMNLREILDENKKTIPDSTRLEPWVGQIPGEHRREFADGGTLANILDGENDTQKLNTDWSLSGAKGNTWYEVDVPENYLQQEWAYDQGGLLRTFESEASGRNLNILNGQAKSQSLNNWDNRAYDYLSRNAGFLGVNETYPSSLYKMDFDLLKTQNEINQLSKNGINVPWPNIVDNAMRFQLNNNDKVIEQVPQQSQNWKNNYSWEQFRDYVNSAQRKVKWKLQDFDGWNEGDLKALYSRLGDTGWDPRAVAFAISGETNFRPYVKSGVSSAIGLGQLTKAQMKRQFGDNWEDVYNSYLNGTRPISDVINDTVEHYKWMHDRLTTEPENMGYGRMKVNLFAPNSSLDDKVPDVVWKNSLTPAQRRKLNRRTATYRDLVNIFDKEFKNYTDSLDAKKLKKSNGGFIDFINKKYSSSIGL